MFKFNKYLNNYQCWMFQILRIFNQGPFFTNNDYMFDWNNNLVHNDKWLSFLIIVNVLYEFLYNFYGS